MLEASARAGAAKVIEVYAPTEDELLVALGRIRAKLEAANDSSFKVTGFRMKRYDVEIDVYYWEGVLLYDFFLEGWKQPDEIDPSNSVAVIEFPARVWAAPETTVEVGDVVLHN